MQLLARLGVHAREVKDLRYRGLGWPGSFVVWREGDDLPAAQMPYRESWGFLQAYRPWATRLWPDGTGELADISCGDPWYEEPDGKNPGFSLVVVRTERGRQILHEAMKAGYLDLRPAEAWKLRKSQAGLARKKGWDRLFTQRLFGLPVPDFGGWNLFGCWLRLPIGQTLRSTLGTARWILVRRLQRPWTPGLIDGIPVKKPCHAADLPVGKSPSRNQLQVLPSIRSSKT